MGNMHYALSEQIANINPKPRVFIYWGPGSYRGGRDETKIMFERKGFIVIPWITFAFLDSSKLTNKDILLFPGGSGHICAKNLQNKNKMSAAQVANKIKDYIAKGVNYLGICAGSYLASNPYEGHDYFGIFNYNGDRSGGNNRGIVDLKIKYKYKNKNGDKNITYHQGPLFHEEIPSDFKVIGWFKNVPDDFTERENYISAPAIIYKKGIDNSGNILLFSPHYEYGNKDKVAHDQFFKIVLKCFYGY